VNKRLIAIVYSPAQAHLGYYFMVDCLWCRSVPVTMLLCKIGCRKRFNEGRISVIPHGANFSPHPSFKHNTNGRYPRNSCGISSMGSAKKNHVFPNYNNPPYSSVRMEYPASMFDDSSSILTVGNTHHHPNSVNVPSTSAPPPPSGNN